MSVKNILLSLFVLGCLSSSVFAEDLVKNFTDLRTLFQNNQSIIYAINLRTFNANDKNGNGIIDFNLGENSGTFLNAIDRLDEIKSLGVNTIHLLPITPVGKIKALGTAGSLYAMSDLTSLNTQLIDSQSSLSPKEQATKFVEECHKRDIRVIVDLPSCGSYDLYINRPDLFVLDENGSPFVPADWTDVRLFDIPNDESLLKSDIFVMHKIFVNYMISIGVDGIRADVATIKPFIFWKELIDYARSKKEGFLFLAEASENWTEPASEKAYFTNYKELLLAGFDGYYGNYFAIKDWDVKQKLESSVINQQKVLKKYSEKKSLIGSFATHDVISPLLTGGESFSKIIIWLNALLPLNPYYVDGFLQSDDYMYEYSNKKANETYTDDEYYYVHQGQIDIFNFSRKPISDYKTLISEQKLAMQFREKFKDVISKGKFIPLNTDNDKIYAFQRNLNKKSVVVVINRNLVNSENVNVKVKKVSKKSKISFIKKGEGVKLLKSSLQGRLKPAEIVVFSIEK